MDVFRDQLIATLSLMEDLPTLPSIIQELERLLHSDSVSMDEIAVVIEEDPAIAASVLRVANSVANYSSMSGRIVSLRDALVRLGLREVQRLVSASAIIQAFGKLGRHLDPKRFWRLSLQTAVAARVIARSAAMHLDEDEAYMAGLLRDTGLLILDQYFPKVYDQIQTAIAAQERPDAEVERLELGLDHGEIGGCLFEQWNLPLVLVEAATWHNQPDRAAPDARLLADAVRVSELITEALEPDCNIDERMQAVRDQPFWAELNITPDGIAAIVEETAKWSTPIFALV